MNFSSGSGRTRLDLQLIPCGMDWAAILTGGRSPHIGAVVLAVPRRSLRGTETSCDCWVIPVAGHKDHIVAQVLAKQLCLASGRVVSVSAGIHVDHASETELDEFQSNCRKLGDHATEWIQTRPH